MMSDKEKEWIDCVQNEVRAFCTAGDWKAMALETGEHFSFFLHLTYGRWASTC